MFCEKEIMISKWVEIIQKHQFSDTNCSII